MPKLVRARAKPRETEPVPMGPNIYVRLDIGLLTWLDAEAEAEGRTRSSQVRWLLRQVRDQRSSRRRAA